MVSTKYKQNWNVNIAQIAQTKFVIEPIYVANAYWKTFNIGLAFM